MSITPANSKPFDFIFWRDIYGSGLDVDGTYNAKEHAKYISSLFDLMRIKVKFLIDVGFGKGVLLKEFAKEFCPERIIAIDPSIEVFKELSTQRWVKLYNIATQNCTIQDFDIRPLKGELADLLICNSILQYVDGDLFDVFYKLSKIAKYVYITIPTDKDYIRMYKELKFKDPYSYSRSKEFYDEAISAHFHKISFNLLQNKHIKTGKFKDELFLM